ncbi:hypothetical protein D3C75_1014960 [compost metagenome]
MFRSKAFKEDLIDIRKKGTSVAQGYPTPSVSTISVPVLDQDGRILLAMTAFSGAASFDNARIAGVADNLRLACERLMSESLESGE